MPSHIDPEEQAILILLQWWDEAEAAITARMQAEQGELWIEPVS